jgi:signal transduction histidine kinase
VFFIAIVDAILLRIVITLGIVIGAMLIVIIFILLLFTSMIIILLKSKRALRLELDLLQAKVKEQPVIYEEIAQLQDSLKSSSPPIDVGENTAYVSAICMNACARVSK